MKKYAQTRIAGLIAKLATQAKRAAENADEDAVHDLRVAIRRLSRGLRAFAQFFPGKSWKQARRELSELMDCAAGVRDRDIAMELLQKAGLEPKARVIATVAKERAEAAKALQHALREWTERDAARQWRGALEL
jgi:CHAD domain-containing protein